MAHQKNRMPWDAMTASQVSKIRQRLRDWWPKHASPRQVGFMIRVLCDISMCSKSTLELFRDSRYSGDSKAIAWHLADFFGVKIPGKEG